MNWFNESSSSSNNIFGDSISDGINLKNEVHTILYGNASRNPKGHWVILRHFDRTKKSSYYNKYSKEGIGGPPHPYVDTLLRMRRRPFPRSDSEDVIKQGSIFSDSFVYYFEHNVTARIGDQIFELDVTDHSNRPTSYNLTKKYDIKRVDPYREDNGNVMYNAAICEYDNITY